MVRSRRTLACGPQARTVVDFPACGIGIPLHYEIGHNYYDQKLSKALELSFQFLRSVDFENIIHMVSFTYSWLFSKGLKSFFAACISETLRKSDFFHIYIEMSIFE